MSTSLPVPNLGKQCTRSFSMSLAQSANRTGEDGICIFKKKNYRISATVEQKRTIMSALTPVLNSGAGRNLIHLRCIAAP